jgi:hypothetical protein
MIKSISIDCHGLKMIWRIPKRVTVILLGSGKGAVVVDSEKGIIHQ